MPTNKTMHDKKLAEKLALEKLALQGFDQSKVLTEFKAIEKDRQAEAKANQSKSGHAFNVLMIAADFRSRNPEAPSEVVADGWSKHGRTVATILAARKSTLAEVVTPKSEKAEQYGRFVQYGQNVWSTAKGVIEYDLNPADYDSYGDVLKEVRQKRKADRMAKLTDEQAELAKAIDACNEAYELLRKLVDTDVGLVKLLTETLQNMAEEQKEQARQQEELEAEANAEAEADAEAIAA